MSKDFRLYEFRDCAEVTHPSEKQTIYVVMQGAVHVIADEKTIKRVAFEVKKAKRKFKKLKEKEELGELMEPLKRPKTFFPYEEINKTEYKVFENEGITFGNDKIITTKGFRPSFGIAIGDQTQILSIPVKSIEDGVKYLANSGENKEKTEFMRRFAWFHNFTQSLKTKFNNVIEKKTFYPGAKLIKEGTNENLVYVIVEGTCSLVCRKSGQKLTVLEYQSDPTKAKRDIE